MTLSTADEYEGGRSLPSLDDLIAALAEDTMSTARGLWRFAEGAPAGLAAAFWKRQPTRAWLARLLALYREALVAEQGERWQRADFFWTELEAAVARAPGSLPLWCEAGGILRDELHVDVPNGGDAVRALVLRELLVDTRSAFYNGRVADGAGLSLDDRAFRHVDALERLVEIAGLEDGERMTLLAGPHRLRISVHEAAKRWRQAADASERAVRHFPDAVEFQESLAAATVREALDAIGSPVSESQNLAEAAGLADRIGTLESLRKRFPLRESIFEYLALLYHLRGVRLAAAGQLSDALVDAQRALAFRPGMQQAEQARGQMLEALEGLQAQMRKVEQAIASQPSAQLSVEGLKLKHEATHGTEPLRAFLASGEPDRIAGDLRRARVEGLWRAIDLTADVKAAGLPETLYAAVSEIAASGPSSAQELRRAWAQQRSHRPELATVDTGRVLTFLERRLLPGADSRGSDDVEAVKSFLSYRGTEGAAVVRRTQRDGGRDREPFREWIFSRQSLRLTLQTAAAIAVVLLAAGGWAVELRARQLRDRAYSDTMAAGDDYIAALRGNEAFFGVSPRARDTAREQEMRDAYSRAFVRWFGQLDDELDPTSLDHVARYRDLVVLPGR